MAFPQATDYRPPIIPDGEVYENPENGKSYYWTQILLPEGSTPDTAESIGGYWTVVCENAEQNKYLLRYGDDVVDATAPALYKWNQSVEFASGSSSLVFDNEGVKITETIEDTTVLKHIVDKQYVDQEVNNIQNEIIDLQEEIEAIAPSLDKGIWEFDNERFMDGDVSRPPLLGMYLLLKGDYPNWTYTDQYTEADAIVFNKTDYNNKLHENWDLVGTDKLIQLYDKPDPDFLLGEINDVLDLGDADNPYGDEAAVVKIKRTESEGSPANQVDTDGKFITFVNIFSAPTGGDASQFVKKTGDTMSGNLAIDRSTNSTDVEAGLQLKGSRPSTTNSAATITFENDQSTALGHLTYRAYASSQWFAFNQDVDLNNNGLHSVAQVRMQPGGYIGSGSAQRIVIRAGSDGSAGTEIQRPGDSKRTFAIRGKAAGSNSISDFFYAYGNSSGGDAINYTGKISSNNNIVNKAYVDSKAGGKVDITCSANGKTVGDMWYCNTDQTLYIKVSN